MAKKTLTLMALASVVAAAVYAFDIFFLVFLGILIILGEQFRPAK